VDALSSAVLLIACIALSESAGVIGSVWTRKGLGWFDSLHKPSFTPPGYLIGVIWTILFALMGISLFLVIEQGTNGRTVTVPLMVFAVQLVLNILWNYFFFARRSPRLGLMEIALLWASIAITIVVFWDVSTSAALLLLPYIAWVSIAAALNASIWSLNRK
jgi:translocator protein